MAATAGSPSSAISRAAPAVSKLSTDSRPRPRIRSPALEKGVGVAPDLPEPPRIGAGKAEQTVPDPVEVLPDDVQARVPQQVVTRATRPPSELSTGIIAHDAPCDSTTSNASSKVGHARGSSSGRASRQARASTPRAPPDRRCGALARTGHRVESRIAPPGRCVSKFASPPRPLAGAFPPRILSATASPRRGGGRTGRETLKA